jgi:predicted nucleotidyltransferase
MKRHEVLSKLAHARPELRREGVARLRLFGSMARDEAAASSDVDLLVEFDNRPIGLFELARLQRRLQALLGVEHVDLITPEGIHPALRQRILSEALDAA